MVDHWGILAPVLKTKPLWSRGTYFHFRIQYGLIK
jgi:hypothetical protein